MANCVRGNSVRSKPQRHSQRPKRSQRPVFKNNDPIECLIEPTARLFPFHYAPDEQIELIWYRLTSYL